MRGERFGGWVQTYTGRAFWPLDPDPSEVHIEDIAHALALQCRFAGHCRAPYSVAEHSVRVANEVERRALAIGYSHDDACAVAFAALLHDASEAYLVDVPRPIKGWLGGYKDIEHVVQTAVWQRFRVATEHANNGLIDIVDAAMLATEARDLMAKPPRSWELREAPLAERIAPWTWSEAKRAFIERFNELCAPRDAL